MDRSESSSLRFELLQSCQTIVVKVGSRVLSQPNGQLDLARIAALSEQLTELAKEKEVALVSSGAVAAGMAKLELAARPKDLAHLQAIASVGQAHLIQTYEANFSQNGRHAAQVLLTAEDIDDRKRYLNLRNTLRTLFTLGTIPIINENDSVSVDELQTTFGDNDRLAAMVAGLFFKPALIILSDVDGLYRNPDASKADREVIQQIESDDGSVLQLAESSSGGIGKGGMQSKLKAAQFATRSGSPVVIAGGKTPNILGRLLQGEELGTLFLPESRGLAPKKRWIGFSAQVVGKVYCDAGAEQALRQNGPSLLAIGIAKVEGSFHQGDVVGICDSQGQEFARGLSNYSVDELQKIVGLRSDAIAEVLGHCPYEEVIHRDNIALM
ncbi:MAG: glutamate 5-kinase [Planctomycetota bacterium]